MAYAAAHNVLSVHGQQHNSRRQLENILATAKAIARGVLSSSSKPRGTQQQQQRQQDDDDGSDDSAAEEPASSNADLPQAIRHFEAFIKKVTNNTAAAEAGSSSPVESSAAATDRHHHHGLPVPSVLVQQMMRRLDGRSAVAAALTCRQMAAAHKLNSCLDTSQGAFQAYCGEVMQLTLDDFSDGSAEAAFAAKWPLDGSAACGADLLRLTTGMEVRKVMRMALPKGLVRPAPDAKSTPLAMFVNSQPAPLNTTRAAMPEPPAPSPAPQQQPQGEMTAEEKQARVRAYMRGDTEALFPDRYGAAAPAPLPPNDVLTAACCNVRVLHNMESGCPMHIDGDLLSFGYATGWKQRDPGLGAAVLHADSGSGSEAAAGGLDCSETHYKAGLFDMISHVCSDAGNGLVWCAADDGKRIKGFRAPEALGGPRSADAGCNRLQDNGMSLQYTLSTDVRRLHGKHTGLHVLGTQVISTNSVGGLFTWDIAEVPPQTTARHSSWALCDDADNVDGTDDDDGPIFKGDLGWRDTDNADDLEVSVGVAPHAVYRLQRPSGHFAISRTCLLHSSSSAAQTMAAACTAFGDEDNIVLTYDLETQQVRNLFLGHISSIHDISPAPEAWPGADNLFATCARSGDVKIWDVRSRCGAAAITLTGSTDPMQAVVLAANRGCSVAAGAAGSSSSGNNQLGAGMLCFAGGSCEAVWAWDLRGGNGQALYQLSTGNLDVESLVWHEGTSSLVASGDSKHEDRHGGCYEESFVKVGQRDREFDFLHPMAPLFGVNIRDLDTADDSGEEDGSDDDGEVRWWPRTAKHQPEDFKAYLSFPHSCVLAYTFSDKASQEVPDSQEPDFA